MDQLENTLDNIAVVTHRFIERNRIIENPQPDLLDSLCLLFPGQNERLTIILDDGAVFFDNEVGDVSNMENHLNRPEVQKSLFAGKGSNIRHSETTGHNYYYYSKYYGKYYVRVAMLYNIEIKNFLKTEQVFIFFILVLFFFMWLLIRLMTNRIGKFVVQLRDISVKAGKGEQISDISEFSDRELATIHQQIVEIYNRLNKTRGDLAREKEKLFQHLNVLNEGIAFYTPEKELILSNSHFIQYINIISEKSVVSMPDIFKIEEFKPLLEFLEINSGVKRNTNIDLPKTTFKISKQEFIFEVRIIIFADETFEVLISDISKMEKRRLIKQQLTANIAHELKTPVASLKGYLETILATKDLTEEKRLYFTQRAFAQSERLADLLDDVSLLNNIEEGGNLFEFKEVKLKELVQDVIENQQVRLNEKGIKCFNELDDELTVYGNDSLLSSIFLNLIVNSIRYAGEEIEIHIRNFHYDQKFHYISYYDTGIGIPGEHLSRIFERFYRIDEGRSRKTGGTGLGLSIVKNAVQLHKGEISVKNRPEGGVEFDFSLARY